MFSLREQEMFEIALAGVFKRFSALGTGMDMNEFMARLYSPCAQGRRSSYLKKEDLLFPCYEFPKKLPEDKSQLRISEINLHDDEVKKLTNKM